MAPRVNAVDAVRSYDSCSILIGNLFLFCIGSYDNDQDASMSSDDSSSSSDSDSDASGKILQPRFLDQKALCKVLTELSVSFVFLAL